MQTAKYVVELTPEQRQRADVIARSYKHTKLERNRAHILLLADTSSSETRLTDKQIAAHVGVCLVTVEQVRRRFVQQGLDAALFRKVQQNRMNLPDNAFPPTVLPQTDLMEAWEDDLKRRYPEPENEAQFRNYDAEARDTVKEFYRQNHRYQTFAFVQEKKQEYTALKKRRMSVWQGMEFLNTLVDDSDPDVDFTQIEHLMQTAEAIRHDGQPRWFILVGLLHDLGKVLCLYGEPQWAVVGDTFPVGCAYSEKIVYPEFFAENPDIRNPVYNTPNGIYRAGCGLDNVHLSWGHDEYLYHVMKDYLPPEALAMIRYHSFYPGHKEGAYTHLMNAHDHEMLKAVRAFNPYDLYSKGLERPNVEALRSYYEALIAEYLPPVLDW